MKYRKKQLVIEAEQYDENDPYLPFIDIDGGGPLNFDEDEGRQYIQTLEGKLWVSHGDWIIRGIKGEFYPCKPDIFVATYEPAE